MLLSWRAPGRAGVVDQDVDIAHALQCFIGQARDVGLLGRIGGNPARVDAFVLQIGGCLLEVARLARADHQPGAGLAQGPRDLKAQAARAARNQCGLARKVEELMHMSCHG